MHFASSALFGTDADAPIKQCPVCRVYIERNEGCAQMMCKNCKHTFCWYCLQNLDVSSTRQTLLRWSFSMLYLCDRRYPTGLPLKILNLPILVLLKNLFFLRRLPEPAKPLFDDLSVSPKLLRQAFVLGTFLAFLGIFILLCKRLLLAY